MYKLFGLAVIMGLCCFPSVYPTDCPQRIDMVFIVDGSGSIGLDNWGLIQDFLVQIVNRLDVRSNRVRVGMVLYSTNPYTMWTLNDDRAKNSAYLSEAIRDLPYLDGRTATPGGLYYAIEQIFEPTGRNNVEKLAVVITDGRSNEYEEYLDYYAQELKDIARVATIGVTEDIDYNELRVIASSECDIYTVDEFGHMDDDMDATISFICGCEPGYKMDTAGSCACVACGVDMYQPYWGQTTCQDCPTGQTTMMEMAAMQCEDNCPAGTYDAGDTNCEFCREGTYQPMTSQTDCMQCPDGHSTRAIGATSMDDCRVICESGHFPASVNGQMVCDECPIGSYQPGTFAESCIPCPDGYTTRQTGSTRREQCEILCDAGFEPYENGTMCSPCRVGTYAPQRSVDECMPCPHGFSTRREGATSEDQCLLVCGRGKVAVERSGQVVCEDCPVGTYQSELFGDQCMDCPAGYNTRQDGSELMEDCEIICDIGMEPSENGTACVPCPIGSYQDQVFGKECRSCPPGESTRDEGTHHIDLCEDLNPPQKSSSGGGGGGGNAGAIAGAVIGALLLILLILLVVFLVMRYMRNRAYAQSATMASADTAPVIGEMEKGKLYDVGQKTNHYAKDPTGEYDNGPNRENPYDNGANRENPYDNGANRENPYDNGANRENPYDNGANRENPYDNGANTENPYDNGANRENIYNNAANTEHPYDNGPNKENIYNNATKVESPYDNGFNTENHYNNAENTESPYDNGLSNESPYDNGAVKESPYDNGPTAPPVEYDNFAKSEVNPYDNTEEVDNQRSGDGMDGDEHIYNNIDENVGIETDENPYDDPLEVRGELGLDNPVYSS